MRRSLLRRLISMAAFVAIMLAPACSNQKPAPDPVTKRATSKPSQPQKGKGGVPAPMAGKTASLAKKPATGALRKHPFVPAIDAKARRVRLTPKAGPLHLKGIIGGAKRMAVIESGSEVYTVEEGQRFLGLRVVKVGDGEVLLQFGQRIQVLQLY